MTTEIIVNIYHLCIVIGAFLLGALLLFLLHNFGGLKLFVDKDKHIADKFLDKFPLVSPEFMSKSSKEQNIENNQEIHEINKRLDKMQFYLDRLNVHQSMTFEEVKK